MRVKNILKFIKKYAFEIAVISSIIFFILIIVFNKQISKYLKNKEELSLPTSDNYIFTYNISENSSTDKKCSITKGIKSPKFSNYEGKNEEKCREIFQTIFKKPFKKCRPIFMKRLNKNSRLELDGYNDELKLAFEYNGIQHYKFSPLFHKSINDFYEQQIRDVEKKELCRRNNITLIEIPSNIKYDKLKDYILDKLKIENIYI